MTVLTVVRAVNERAAVEALLEAGIQPRGYSNAILRDGLLQALWHLGLKKTHNKQKGWPFFLDGVDSMIVAKLKGVVGMEMYVEGEDLHSVVSSTMEEAITKSQAEHRAQLETMKQRALENPGFIRIYNGFVRDFKTDVLKSAAHDGSRELALKLKPMVQWNCREAERV
jgi:hypothetical protein